MKRPKLFRRAAYNIRILLADFEGTHHPITRQSTLSLTNLFLPALKVH